MTIQLGRRHALAGPTPRRGFPPGPCDDPTHRGLEIRLVLRPGIPDERFVAGAIGNLAAFRLQQKRRERLEWQVLKVEESGSYHYRLVIRHPERVLDLGAYHDLEGLLDSLSNETVEELRRRFDSAQREGLRPVPVRAVHESPDLWKDDFWNWFG